jgi:hypothetical protein
MTLTAAGAAVSGRAKEEEWEGGRNSNCHALGMKETKGERGMCSCSIQQQKNKQQQCRGILLYTRSGGVE